MMSRSERSWHRGSCHCGAVVFEVSLTRRLTITECNCGICYMSGHRELLVQNRSFRLISGREHLKEYRFGVGVADHTFCVVCGIMPFYRPRSNPDTHHSVNARCISTEFAESIEIVPFDGQNWEQSIAADTHVHTE